MEFKFCQVNLKIKTPQKGGENIKKLIKLIFMAESDTPFG